MMKNSLGLLATSVALALSAGYSQAESTPHFSQSVHGGVGLIQLPTARMNPEGSLAMNYSDNEEYRFWSVSLQLFPWMESTVRYADIRTKLYSPFPGFSGDQTLKDKGIDVKFRLLQEGLWHPEVSVGFRDFGGTGLFESEFVALSKRYYDLDFHLGMGWGYLGAAGNSSNPWCEVASRFCERPSSFGGRGGKIDYQNFFRGPASLFAGVEYQTPWSPLTLKLEYEGNDYLDDPGGELQQDSRWNVAARYRWHNWDLQLNYQRGNTFGFHVNYLMNLHHISQPRVDVAAPALDELPEATARVSQNRLREALSYYAGFSVLKLVIDDESITVYGGQMRYNDRDEALERIGRVLASYLPAHIERYVVVEQSDGLPMVTTHIDAARFIAAVRHESIHSSVRSTYVRSEPDGLPTSWDFAPKVRGFSWGAEVFWNQMFGSPESFYMYQGGIVPGAQYQFNANTSIQGAAKVTLLENFDKFNFKVDNEDVVLPRVRTYVREYVTRSRVTMDSLFLDWREQLSPELYMVSYGGYLETMFAGVGTEVLYRPLDQSFAVGFDVNYVQQRSFKNDFGLRDYKVLTGHVNLYLTPDMFENTRFLFKAGRFLAGDTGVHFDMSRRFDSGITVGAFAAITNVSAQDYGEGSFTKGFYLTIPFDLMSLRPSRGQGTIPWIPIARDGGQLLNRPVSAYDMTSARGAW